MNLLPLLRKRRSVRRYLKKSIPIRVQSRLKEACLRAPSSRNIQPWMFHFVENKDILQKLAQCKAKHADFIQQAPLAVVISANPEGCDTWMEDCSIAAILLQMAALDAGLGSCWAQVHKRRHADGQSAEDYVRELMGLPYYQRILCIIALGYPATHPQPIAEEKLNWDRIWRV